MDSNVDSSFLENVGACTSTPIQKESGCSVFNSRKRKISFVRDESEVDFKARQIHHSVDSHMYGIRKSPSDSFTNLSDVTSSSVITMNDDTTIEIEKTLVKEDNESKTSVIVKQRETLDETLTTVNETFFTVSETYCTDASQLSDVSSIPIDLGDDRSDKPPSQEITSDSVLFVSEFFQDDRDNKESDPGYCVYDNIKRNQPCTVGAYSDVHYQRPTTVAIRTNTCSYTNVNKKHTKRMVIIDGSNVAFAHSSERKEFSVEGIDICINYFAEKGHDVKAVVPQMRLKRSQSTNSYLLGQLKDEGKLIITPCKSFPNGKSLMSYDDRFILDIAHENDAVVISNDNYRDLFYENEKYKKIIESRVIGYTFCNDSIYLPTDPYGKNGPLFHEILTRQVQ